MKPTFLSRFTPSLMKPEDLETVFVQREAVAQYIIQLIRDSALTSRKHHTLLTGPRGIGKTHLISLIYYRIRKMDDLRNYLFIAWLREEEWGVTSFLDLLLRIFRALLVEYNDKALDERVKSLYSLPSDAAEHEGAKFLKEFVGARTLLVLMENLDEVFGELGNEGQKRLHTYLQENPFWTILATAQRPFNGAPFQTSPFYDLFYPLYSLENPASKGVQEPFPEQKVYYLSLEELGFGDAMRLLKKIAGLKGDSELVSFIQTPTGRARIHALHHLAGGNHRVYVILSEFLNRKSLDDLVEPFTRALDELTLFFQERMRWISPQQRKIVEFLCDYSGSAPVKEIAQRCFMTPQTASSQLKTLREIGYVRSIPNRRESHYELCEPLVRLYAEVKRSRGEPRRSLVNFLRLWYSPSELQHLSASFQSDSFLEREYLLYTLREAQGEIEDQRVVENVKALTNYLKVGDFVHGLEAAQELVDIRGRVRDRLALALCLRITGRQDEVLKVLDKAIESEPKNALAWMGRGKALLNLGRRGGTSTSFKKVLELDPLLYWACLGVTRLSLGYLDKALALFEKVLELDSNNVLAWIGQGKVRSLRSDYEEALTSFKKAVELEPNNPLAWACQGLELCKLGRYNEALVSCDKAIELGEQSLCAFSNRAESLLALGHWDEGIIALDGALCSFAHEVEHIAGHTMPIVCNLLTSSHNPVMWRTRVTTLIEVYDNHRVFLALGGGLVKSIQVLKSPMVSDAAARAWLAVWQELAGNRKEFEIPLRLLDAAVRYRETKDRRALLELPIEERRLLEPLLGVGDANAEKD
jgi:tetratricopeptide (TPR) repeat protein